MREKHANQDIKDDRECRRNLEQIRACAAGYAHVLDDVGQDGGYAPHSGRPTGPKDTAMSI